jgi:hypothetical protein
VSTHEHDKAFREATVVCVGVILSVL